MNEVNEDKTMRCDNPIKKQDMREALYEKIASVFKTTNYVYNGTDYWKKGGESIWLLNVENMSDMLAQDNPRFDRGHFLKACGALLRG